MNLTCINDSKIHIKTYSNHIDFNPPKAFIIFGPSMGNWAIQNLGARDIQSAQILGFKSLDRSLKSSPLNRPKNSSKDLVRLPISDGIGPRKAGYLWARSGDSST